MTTAPDSTTSNFNVTFRPIWMVDEPGVGLFQAIKPSIASTLENLDDQIKLELMYLKRVVSALRSSMAEGQDVKVLVRLSGKVLAQKEGACEIVDFLRTLSQAEHAQMVFELEDFPDKMDLGILEDITIPLMPFSETFYACPEPSRTNYTLFANVNYAGVVLDLGNKPLDVKLAGKLFKLFESRAKPCRLPMWVLGIAAEDVAKVARIYQVDALSGKYMQTDSIALGPAITENQPFMV